jgi:hypothetical protein
VFERFTDRARRIVVLAQEEARLLDHNYIGTEHLLLGIVHDGEGVAARSLIELGESLDGIRRRVEEIVGQGPTAPSGHIPFTPRAKKVLELALREALQLGHKFVGSEHILLGLVREGEGVAAQVLVSGGLSLEVVRQQVLRTLAGHPESELGEDLDILERGPEAAVGWVADQPRGPRPRGRFLAGRRRPSNLASPSCSWCGCDLAETAQHRTMTVPGQQGEAAVRLTVVFCTACGETVAAEVLPDDDAGPETAE